MWDFKSFAVLYDYNPNDDYFLVKEFAPFIFIIMLRLLLCFTVFVLPGCFLPVFAFHFDLSQNKVYLLCFLFPPSDFQGINPTFSLLTVNLTF